MQHVIAAAAQKVPPYCTSGVGIRTPHQWQTCWNLGYNLPTTGAANAGFTVGHNAPWALLVGILIGIILLASRSRSRSPATSK